MDNEVEIQVHRETRVITVKRKGISALTEANILGIEVENEEELIYLDRLIHKHFEDRVGEYSVKGAISSILSKKITQ